MHKELGKFNGYPWTVEAHARYPRKFAVKIDYTDCGGVFYIKKGHKFHAFRLTRDARNAKAFDSERTAGYAYAAVKYGDWDVEDWHLITGDSGFYEHFGIEVES